MSQVLITRLAIRNFGPIVKDEVICEPFTYFIGRNNVGKSHYLKAVETLLATKTPSQEEIEKIQNNNETRVEIEADFVGTSAFANLLEKSNHKQKLKKIIHDNDVLTIVRRLDTNDPDASGLGVIVQGAFEANPFGNAANLLKILPEPISILATADTLDELKSTQKHSTE